jgi:hypothetical protein
LLAADDAGEPGKAWLTAPERGLAGLFQHRQEPRISLDELGEGCGEVGLGVEEVNHASVSLPSLTPKLVYSIWANDGAKRGKPRFDAIHHLGKSFALKMAPWVKSGVTETL